MFAQQIRQNNLLPVIECMSPECRIPDAVHLLNRVVLLFQPHVKCLLTVFAVTLSAVFIGDMPCHNIVIVFVMFRQLLRQSCRIHAVYGTVRTGIVPASELALHSVELRAQDFRVPVCHPCRMRAGRCCKHDLQSVFLHQFHNAVQFCKIIGALVRLQHCPGKHIECHRINVRQPKQVHIFLPGCLIPLLRIVVAAKRNFILIPYFLVHCPLLFVC